MLNRRRFLTTSGCYLGISSLSGCAGLLSNGSDGLDYPSGTVIVENTDDTSLAVSITVVEDEYDAEINGTVSGGETLVRREFVTADDGDVVTLAAKLGDSGDATRFQFLPAGKDDAPSEVARLTVKNAVEASATWTATKGS